MNQYKFLRIYKDLAKSRVHPDDLEVLFWELKYLLENDSDVGHRFKISKNASNIEKAMAIDAVAHNIHKQGKIFLNKVFPGGDVNLFKRVLDELSGLESSSEVRRSNRGYYTPIMATEGMIWLEKSNVGKISQKKGKDDIKNYIKEYEDFISIGIATPAQILTVDRYYDGNNDKYNKLVKRKGLNKDDNHPLVVGGPASVVGIDKEGHLITSAALKKAFDSYMKNVWARNMNVYHSDVQAGWALPCYISSDGTIYISGVDDNGLWVVSEIRDDTRVARRLAEEIEKGNITCYSIGGSAVKTNVKTRGYNKFLQVDEMELQEITYCEEGVNPGAEFEIIKSIHSNNKIDYDYNYINGLIPNSYIIKDLTYWHDCGIIIKADMPNSVTDRCILMLQDYLPDNIKYSVSNILPSDAQLLYGREENIQKGGEINMKEDNLPDISEFILSKENGEGVLSNYDAFRSWIENNNILKAKKDDEDNAVDGEDYATEKGEEKRKKLAADIAVALGIPETIVDGKTKKYDIDSDVEKDPRKFYDVSKE